MPELDAIHTVAKRVLAQDPDPVVRLRLLRDVLQKPTGNHDLVQAQENLAQSRWVRELEREQWDDGSWGRLHSRDSSAKQKILTTEAGVERALALGLDGAHPVLQKASRYLAGMLEGTLLCRDPAEKNDRWPTGVRLFAASTLAQIRPDLPLLDSDWKLWANIARRTFASGSYDPEAEIQAHRELTGASIKDSYLVINNKYALILLGSRATALLPKLEAALMNWVWHGQDGMRYLGEPLSHPPQHRKASRLDRWLTSLELLSRFPGWRSLAGEAIQWLWDERTSEGFWELGPRSSSSLALPLSENWRRKTARQFDWTTRVLVLLRRYHFQDSGQ